MSYPPYNNSSTWSAAKSYTIECWSCHGDGEVQYVIPLDPIDDPFYADYPSYRTCLMCGGTGKVRVEVKK